MASATQNESRPSRDDLERKGSVRRKWSDGEADDRDFARAVGAISPTHDVVWLSNIVVRAACWIKGCFLKTSAISLCPSVVWSWGAHR